MNGKDSEKEQKAGNPIFILIIFVCLLLFIFVVPDVYKKLNKNVADVLGIGKKETPVQEKTKDDTPAMSDYYQIGSNSTLEYNGLIIKNVSLVEGILSFDIESEEEVDLSESDYYIEFYESRATFRGRRMLKGKINKTLRVELDVSSLNINTSTYMTVSHIEESSIPKSTFSTDESGLASLNCMHESDNYVYDFKLDELIKITKKYTYTNYDLNSYSSELLKYQKLSKEYNELNGVTTSIAENNSTFIYTIELDYTDVEEFNKIKDDYIFKKGTLDSVIKFKMESEGFDCE